MTPTKSYVLDSNIMSYILRKNKPLIQRLRNALAAGETIMMCPVVYFEIKRGLLKKNAAKQLQFFDNLISWCQWDDFTLEDWNVAAELWAQREVMGNPIEDADLLIAVYARRRDATLVTNNERHFAHLDLTLENWTAA